MSTAEAHPVDPGEAGSSWNLDPLLIATLGIALMLYALGARRLWKRARRGRLDMGRRIAFFAGGWFVAAAATLTPLHTLSGQSFTLHMIEHELLMLVVAPLVVLARPLSTMLWAFPGPARQGIAGLAGPLGLMAMGRALMQPVPATLLQAAALWLWHLPSLFGLALESNGWHLVQHLSFFVTALLFWSAMLRPKQAMLAAFCLFLTAVIGGGLGALMGLSASPWYARYAALGVTWGGLDPLHDQQLAGLLMWVPAGFVHCGAALALLHRALRKQGTPLRRHEEKHMADSVTWNRPWNSPKSGRQALRPE